MHLLLFIRPEFTVSEIRTEIASPQPFWQQTNIVNFDVSAVIGKYNEWHYQVGNVYVIQTTLGRSQAEMNEKFRL